jgi:hypothetical protein
MSKRGRFDEFRTGASSGIRSYRLPPTFTTRGSVILVLCDGNTGFIVIKKVYRQIIKGA